MTPFESAYITVSQLSEQFGNNFNYYTSPNYQEAEARKDFIDKLFVALGWDVNHDYQMNPYEQEVRVEKAQRQQNSISQKRADYAFYTSPNYKDVRFFVEAKKPSVGLRHQDHYFQTVRYGWNANTPVAVLTDFEEFHIIDCRYKPNIDYIFNGQHKQYHYTDFRDKEKFAEIYWLFSHEAVLNNSLEKYAETLGRPKGKSVQKTLFKLETHAIDESFLYYIDSLRENLAKAFKKNNPALNSEELTEATQRTVDRLVFIRFLEDKLIEPINHVSEWKNWKDFISDCRKLDVKYNGVVFKSLFIDNASFSGAEEQMFKDICADISNLNTPYDFNYIPIHILGSIYERFLGKIVRATDKRVFIEEKPEVRKAGGVYYTPKYIVDFIVLDTVGKLIRNKTPKEIDLLHFADIACGSGSFLISVYDCLLDYHKKYYVEKLKDKIEIDKRSEDYGNVEYRDNQWILTLKRKQEILLNNIYGVDIDPQAVEVTQLSLFLKMLEDETVSSTQIKQGTLFSKVLPDLAKNIICGNSLINTDILSDQLFSFEEEKKLNPLNYSASFSSIMKSGGFDAIVGNPPYVRIQHLQETSPISVTYFSNHYKSGGSGNYDLYVLFIEKAFNTIKEKGLLGYIVPNKFFNTDYGRNLRGLLSDKQLVSKIIDFGHTQIFQSATTYTCLLFLSKIKKSYFKYKKIADINDLLNDEYVEIDLGKITADAWSFANKVEDEILAKLNIDSFPLIDLPCSISRGSSTGNDKIFILEKKGDVYINGYGKIVDIEEAILKKPIYATDFKRYQFNRKGNYYLIFPYNMDNEKSELYDEKVLRMQFPKTFQYLNSNKKLLEERKQFQNWYAYSAPRSLKLHDNADIVIPLLADHGMFSKLPENKSDYTLMASGGFSITIENESYRPNYILALINSKLLYWQLQKLSNVFRGGWITCTKQYFSQLFIKKINKHNKATYDKILVITEQMILAKKQILLAKTERDKEFLSNKCNSFDAEIDLLVYELFGLTVEEIQIIEMN